MTRDPRFVSGNAIPASPALTSMRWLVCFFLFLATTINYIDRSVVALIEPMLHLPFMGWIPGVSPQYQTAYNNAYGDTVIAFQIVYGVGLLTTGRIIDKLGTKLDYTLAILIWSLASMGHSLIHSVVGFCVAIACGWFSGSRIKSGSTVNSGRKAAMLSAAMCVLPLMLVPHMHDLSPTNAWPAIGLFSLAAAAHQGWSANLYSTPTDMFPSTSISTVIGIGSACGAAGGAIFTWVVKHYFSVHPLPIFVVAACSYVFALAVFQLFVPQLGPTLENRIA